MLIGAIIGAFLVCFFARIVATKAKAFEQINWSLISLDVIIASMIGAIIGYFVS